MNRRCGLVLLLSLSVLACQPAPRSPILLIDSQKITTINTRQRTPRSILEEAGVRIQPQDLLLVDGLDVSPDDPLPRNIRHIQIRRAVPIQLRTADGERQLLTSALTVAKVLEEAEIWLRAGEKVIPAPDSPVVEGMSIAVTSSRELRLRLAGQTIRFNSSGETVGAVLAEAGVPLLGLDYSVPAEGEPIPPDGQMRVVRVGESVQLVQKPIPFETELQASANVPLDQIQILEPGETGLAVERIRIRHEDGAEVSRLAEAETLVRPPSRRLMGYGTKIEVRTAVVDGQEIEYWRAVQMYATSYSPCRSGVDRCLGGSSSGMPLRKGVVGLRYDWFLSMQGQRLYVPSYGFATVGDVCNGCVGRPWIDLGYSDGDFEPWSLWVTVYFLTPVPPNVIYVLE